MKRGALKEYSTRTNTWYTCSTTLQHRYDTPLHRYTADAVGRARATSFSLEGRKGPRRQPCSGVAGLTLNPSGVGGVRRVRLACG